MSALTIHRVNGTRQDAQHIADLLKSFNFEADVFLVIAQQLQPALANSLYAASYGSVDYDAQAETMQEEIYAFTEPTLCGACNGSGEGQHDGTTCRNCDGKGEIASPDMQAIAESYINDFASDHRHQLALRPATRLRPIRQRMP